ncbi:MAG: aspartate aminotransferase family protein [Deltaproteobacteria bacterium]|nr:MAG: aspartate aminotransferase family protein [Deltaproteobacteria bacterium]
MHVFERWESEIRGYSRAYPTVFASARGATMTDEAGRSYIDFFAGAGVLNFGHNNPRMKEAIIAFLEADGMIHSLDMATTPKREFIQAFVDTILAPRGWDHRLQFMGPTGTNAVEAALKLARRVTGRSTVVAFSHGFHGMTLGALACTANQYFRNAAGVPLQHVIRLPFENAPGGGVDALRQAACAWEDPSAGLEPPAAVVLEVIQAEGGVNVASREWLHAAQAFARHHGALLIVDDIQAGCGRTGSYFSFDGMDLDPDIVCLAKGIGGFGTPMAMNLVKPEHDRHWSPGEHTGTFRGQGISFVAGREALRYFEDDSLMGEVREKGATMRTALQDLAERHPAHRFAVRGRGMMQAIDVHDGALAKDVARRCFESGLVIGPCGSGGRVLKLIPPLTIERDQLDRGLAILGDALDAAIREAE